MEGSRWKVEFMKPVILKVGIPLAVSVAGLIWSKIIARQRMQNNDSFRCKESDDHQERNGSGRFEDEFLRLRKLIESVEEREKKLEMQFLHFCEMKDRETVIMEIGKMLKMEMAKVEMMEEMEKENGVLKRKVTKLWRIVREQLSLIRENDERIAAAQQKMGVDDEQKTYYLNKIDDEMKGLRRTLDEMNLEKCEILEKLSFLQQSISKMEALSMEEYRHLEKEVEHLQEGDVTEEEEVVRLRWRNDNYLRNEVGTELQEQQPDKENNCLQLATVADEHKEEEQGVMVGTSSSSVFGHMQNKKKKKLLHKLHKWVELIENRKVKPSDDEMK